MRSGPGSQLLDPSAEGSKVHPGRGPQAATSHHHLSQVRSGSGPGASCYLCSQMLLRALSVETFHCCGFVAGTHHEPGLAALPELHQTCFTDSLCIKVNACSPEHAFLSHGDTTGIPTANSQGQ